MFVKHQGCLLYTKKEMFLEAASQQLEELMGVEGLGIAKIQKK